MPPTNNGLPEFDVSYPTAVLEQLDRWADLARRIGLQLQYLQAIREMRRRLPHDPREYGDPLR